MEQSTNYNFNLPSKNDETSADIDLISDNFRTVDDVVKQVQDDVSKIPTNLVNGSAEGSLRGVNAKEEGNGYTIGQNAVAIGSDTEASGYASYAEGRNTTASGNSSHAEGGLTTASGSSSHAEGEGGTTASGTTSHAEGSGTTASGDVSHAEGGGTIASGEVSHAEGICTIASGDCQHAQGKFNIADNDNKYLHIVGNGEDDENRSNAHTLDWDGNAWFAGDVYVGGTSQDDESATKLSSVATDISQVKEKLDGIEEGANKTVVDSELSTTSTNPIQNKVIVENLDKKVNLTNGTIQGAVDWNTITKTGCYKIQNCTMTAEYNAPQGEYGFGVLQVLNSEWETGTSADEHRVAQIYIPHRSRPYSLWIRTNNSATGYDNWNDWTPFDNANQVDAKFTDVNSALDKKVYLTNGTVSGAVDWNTITKTGCYKIQNCTMTADYNAPQGEYGFGVLQVLNSEWETGTSADEHRVVQIYIPHRHMLKYGIHIRSNNSATGYNDWTDWVGFYNAKQVDPKLETKASVETGICTLTVSNGSVSNASYSKTGKDVTVNFWFYPDDTNEVVVSGLPYVATKNQSGIASASVGGVRVSYEMSKDNANATLYPETTSEQYCTLTYNLGAYNPQL